MVCHFQILLIAVLIVKMIHLPTIVALAVWAKNRRKKRKIINLPTGLQFHETDEDFDIESKIATDDKNDEIIRTPVEFFFEESSEIQEKQQRKEAKIEKCSGLIKILRSINEDLDRSREYSIGNKANLDFE